MGDTIDFNWEIEDFGHAEKLREELLRSTEEYCIVGYSGRITALQVFETCKEIYPVILDGEKYSGSTIYLLGKTGADRRSQHPTLLSAYTPFDDLPSRSGWTVDTAQLVNDTSATLLESQPTYRMDQDNNFGPEYRFQLSSLGDYRNRYIKVVVAAALQEGGQLVATISASRDGAPVHHSGSPYWRGENMGHMLLASGRGYAAFEVPHFIREDDDLSIILWNPNPSSPVQLHRMELWLLDNIWND